MRYLTLSPDYSGSCLKEDDGDYIEIEELSLPTAIIEKINNWHSGYRKIIPLDEENRFKRKELIDRLDSEGIAIAKQLMSSIEGGAKIKYFSEGYLKYLPVL